MFIINLAINAVSCVVHMWLLGHTYNMHTLF